MRLTVDDILAPGGLVAAKLPGFEQRAEQLAMARAVAEAFADREHLIVEAGTGVGKSFAYLVPAILRAAADRQRIVVSTYTIALQEQLIHKDLPFLAEVLPLKFSAVLGKGRNNYICFRRMALAAGGRGNIFGSQRQLKQFDKLAHWAMETQTGSLQEIDFAYDRSVWEKVRCDSTLCQGSKCKQYGKCHFQAARRKLQQADIAVVNHALFFSDLAMQNASANILGKYDLVVLDEAHTVEQVAGDHFGKSVTSTAAMSLLRDLYNDRTNRGLLSLLADTKSIKAVNRAAGAAEGFFARLAAYRGPALSPNGRIKAAGIVPNDLSPAMNELAETLKALRAGLNDEAGGYEIQAYQQRCEDMAEKIQWLISQVAEDYAHDQRVWLEDTIIER